MKRSSKGTISRFVTQSRFGWVAGGVGFVAGTEVAGTEEAGTEDAGTEEVGVEEDGVDETEEGVEESVSGSEEAWLDCC